MAARTKTPTKTKKTAKKSKKTAKRQPIRQYPTEAPRPAPNTKFSLGQQIEQSYTPEREEKIRRLTELQEIDAQIQGRRGYGQDTGSLEAIRDIKMPIGFGSLEQVSGVMSVSVTKKRRTQKATGMSDRKRRDAMNIAKAESLDILQFF